MKKYDLVAPTSIGLRLLPENRQPVELSRSFILQSTSAESNVLQISASLGLNTMLLTVFVQDNAMASFIKNDLRMRNISYTGPDVPAGDPWGYRHQINIADSGFGLRAPIVYNDRSGEIGRILKSDLFNLDQLLLEDGVRLIHFSGLIAALSEETAQFCLDLAERAKENGTLISFDLNYRASFWEGKEDFLREVFSEIATLSDILIGNEEDYQLALGIPGPKISVLKDDQETVQGYQKMIAMVKEKYPDTKYFATTLRNVISANTHEWGALLHVDGITHIERLRKIDVRDRIGGGDGFVGGLLYGLLQKYDARDCLALGWAAGVLAVSSLTDYAMPINEQQLWSIYGGNARIQR